jgi:hypothetical protein
MDELRAFFERGYFDGLYAHKTADRPKRMPTKLIAEEKIYKAMSICLSFERLFVIVNCKPDRAAMLIMEKLKSEKQWLLLEIGPRQPHHFSQWLHISRPDGDIHWHCLGGFATTRQKKAAASFIQSLRKIKNNVSYTAHAFMPGNIPPSPLGVAVIPLLINQKIPLGTLKLVKLKEPAKTCINAACHSLLTPLQNNESTEPGEPHLEDSVPSTLQNNDIMNFL